MHVLVLLSSACFTGAPTDAPASNPIAEPLQREKTLEECKQLKHDELCDYVEGLGRRRNCAALERLYKAAISQYAITVYARILDDQEVIPFCKRFPLGSGEWVYAFWGLDAHRKDAVIDYVKDTCQRGNPYVRSVCYSLCMRARWADLTEYAERDATDNTPMEAIGWTLGSYAKAYLRDAPAYRNNASIRSPDR